MIVTGRIVPQYDAPAVCYCYAFGGREEWTRPLPMNYASNLHQIFEHFSFLTIALARYFSGGIVIRFVLPVYG